MPGIRRVTSEGSTTRPPYLTMTLPLTLAVLLVSLLPATQGQVICNMRICVTNALCNVQEMQCDCDEANGYFGYGRVVCVGNDRCVCGAVADPHFFLFDPMTNAQMIKVNLPCSVVLASAVTYASPDPVCLVDLVLAHPETRGSGPEKDIRVFVKEVQVKVSAPSSITYMVNLAGTTSPAQLPATVTTGMEDGFNTATLTSCSNLIVGYNGTFGGAFLDIKRGASSMGPGLCGNCDNTADELPEATNITELAYFLTHLAELADQIGDFATECGAIQSSVANNCMPSMLIEVADICGRYLTSFGICLINMTVVANFGQLLESKFRSCLHAICTGGSVSITNWCNQLSTDSLTCPLGATPVACAG